MILKCLNILFEGVVALDGYMYAVGGYDSSSQLRTVERYCMVTDKWEFVAPMRSPRSALSVAVLAGKLYALGREKEKTHETVFGKMCGIEKKTCTYKKVPCFSV